MSTHGSSYSCNHDFRKGDEIEVLRHSNDGNLPVWLPATVIDSPSPEGTLHVKFTTLYTERYNKKGKLKRKKIKDYVNLADGVTRPVAHAEPHRCFVVGEEVEVLHEKEWRKGEVTDVVENSMYIVVIGGAVEVMVEKSKVRVYRDESSLQSTLDPQQEKSSEVVLQSRKRTKFRIISKSRTVSTDPFPIGTPVEVRSFEEGYQGSWYTAMVVGSVDEGKILVQYETLTTDDETQQLVEMAGVSNVRPVPPKIHRIGYSMLEEVDAWYNDGWWVGHVSKVLGGLKYAVYFWVTNEEYEFQHSQLRPHQELVNGKWVASFLRPKLAKRPRLEKIELRTGGRILTMGLLRGLKVEIAHGEDGFLTTWYPAVILGPVNNGKYLVEYRTLKTDNGRGVMKEEVDVLCIRPCPLIIQRPDQYQPNDRVDAWDFNGWQVGQIYKTMKEFKYEVFFWATKTVAEYRHDYLRPHQDFVDGAWLNATTDVPP